jgi:hypothetical protein
MELLLNLAWLLLALPAYWLWRDSRSVRAGRRFTSVQCFLTLGCMLVVLFPVISATDDLRAMRAEGEESPVSKRSVLQASGDKPSHWNWQHQPAFAVIPSSSFVRDEAWHQIPALRLSLSTAPVVQRASRAPPVSLV